jgi:hypothetical protein
MIVNVLCGCMCALVKNPLLFHLLMKRFLSNGIPDNQLCIDLMSGMSNAGLAAQWASINYLGVENNMVLVKAARSRLLKCYCEARARIDDTHDGMKLSVDELSYMLSPPQLDDDSTSPGPIACRNRKFCCKECGRERYGLSWTAQFDSFHNYYCAQSCRRHHEYMSTLSNSSSVSGQEGEVQPLDQPFSISWFYPGYLTKVPIGLGTYATMDQWPRNPTYACPGPILQSQLDHWGSLDIKKSSQYTMQAFTLINAHSCFDCQKSFPFLVPSTEAMDKYPYY